MTEVHDQAVGLETRRGIMTGGAGHGQRLQAADPPTAGQSATPNPPAPGFGVPGLGNTSHDGGTGNGGAGAIASEGRPTTSMSRASRREMRTSLSLAQNQSVAAFLTYAGVDLEQLGTYGRGGEQVLPGTQSV